LNLILGLLLGAGSLIGPALGAGIIVLLKNLVSVYTQRWLLILGAVYILTIVYAPEGILGAMRRRTKQVKPRTVGVHDLTEEET